MTSKHNNAHREHGTPLPWVVDNYKRALACWIRNKDGWDVAKVSNCGGDAEFIVTACNQHYDNKALISELVELLEKWRPRLVASNNELAETDAALSKAKGGEA